MRRHAWAFKAAVGRRGREGRVPCGRGAYAPWRGSGSRPGTTPVAECRSGPPRHAPRVADLALADVRQPRGRAASTSVSMSASSSRAPFHAEALRGSRPFWQGSAPCPRSSARRVRPIRPSGPRGLLHPRRTCRDRGDGRANPVVSLGRLFVTKPGFVGGARTRRFARSASASTSDGTPLGASIPGAPTGPIAQRGRP